MGTLGNRKSLRWKMVRMMLFGWLLPLLILTLGMIFTVSSMIKNQLEKTIVVSSDKAMEICDMQFQEMIVSSKIVPSGLNCTLVPVFSRSQSPITFNLLQELPLSYR